MRLFRSQIDCCLIRVAMSFYDLLLSSDNHFDLSLMQVRQQRSASPHYGLLKELFNYQSFCVSIIHLDAFSA